MSMEEEIPETTGADLFSEALKVRLKEKEKQISINDKGRQLDPELDFSGPIFSKDQLWASSPNATRLVETKKADGNWEELRCRLWFKGCLSIRSRGKAGGLALLWKDEVGVELQSFLYSHIDVRVKGEEEFFLQCSMEIREFKIDFKAGIS
ncbi:hypothetical protein QQ045_015424 [Rhodiola kirilowii]